MRLGALWQIVIGASLPGHARAVKDGQEEAEEFCTFAQQCSRRKRAARGCN